MSRLEIRRKKGDRGLEARNHSTCSNGWTTPSDDRVIPTLPKPMDGRPARAFARKAARPIRRSRTESDPCAERK
jgi:hypothetical protein